MKLTPWFPGSVRPARPGVYERRFGLTDTQRYAYWDGYFWGIGGITPEESLLYKRSRSAAQLKAMGVMWRGLAEEPEKT